MRLSGALFVALLSTVALGGCGAALDSDRTDGSALSTIDFAEVGGSADLAVPPFDAAQPGDGATAPTADLALPLLGPETLTFQLDAGAFPPTPSHPSALVYIPSRFDPTPPIALIVYIHGFYNCVENIVRDGGQSCDPTNGTPKRNAYSLAAQLETSGKNALLLAPEVRFDTNSGAAGSLGNANGFRTLLAETLADLEPVLGHRTVADIGTVVLVSHSGGYTVADGIATLGGVPVQEIFLLDSLYNYPMVAVDFEKWAKQDLGTFVTLERRFADVYTTNGGTLANSQMMASDIHALFPLDGGTVVDDRVPANTWTTDVYAHGFLFKYSMLAHDDVPRYYFSRLVSSSSLPNKR